MHARTRIVDILRDFAEVHRRVHELAEQHRAGELRFSGVSALTGDDESSVLFRLKERTHALFRGLESGSRSPSYREALFDLAVGSLFHESMKLRESLYQREVYGPRVRELHSGAGHESKQLFEEFEKMLGTIGAGLDEGVREVESLTRRTAEQLRLLLTEDPDDGCARFLTEQADGLESLFGVPLSTLFTEFYGSPSKGYECAGRSYLASGSFEAAADRFERALTDADAPEELSALRDYALGMSAYVNRDYATSVRHLDAWSDLQPHDPALVPLARDALNGITRLAGREGDVPIGAAKLLGRLSTESAQA